MAPRKKSKKGTGESQLPCPFKPVLQTVTAGRNYLKTFADVGRVAIKRLENVSDESKVSGTNMVNALTNDIQKYSDDLDEIESKVLQSKKSQPRNTQVAQALGRSGEALSVVDNINTNLLPLTHELMALIKPKAPDSHNKPADNQE